MENTDNTDNNAPKTLDGVLMEAVENGDVKGAFFVGRLYLEKRQADDYLEMRKKLFGF